MSTISSDDLRAILAGCEGVTPGPWEAGHHWVFVPPLDAANNQTKALRNILRDVSAEELQPNAAHIARLDPQTVASIITELLSLRESHPIEDGEGWAIYLPSADQTITVTRDEVTTELEAILSGGWDLRTEAALRVAIQAIYHSNPGTSKVENTPST